MKLQTLLAAVVAAAVSLGAQAWDGTEGKVYLQNVGSGLWWGAGNDWGTRGTLLQHPEYVTLHGSDGSFTMESQVDNGNSSYWFAGDYMDGSSDKAITLTITQVGDYYTIANGSSYFGYDGTSTLLGKGVSADSDNGKWRIYSQSEMVASLASATAAAPVDATFLIADPGFGRNNRSKDSWTYSSQTSDEKTNFSISSTSNWPNGYCCESYHAYFTISQSISSVPNGVYGMKAHGFYRQDGTDNAHIPYFFLNSGKRYFPLRTGTENSMQAAASAFAAGNYETEELLILVTDNTISIGAALDGNYNLWCAFSYFELNYYGNGTDVHYTIPITNDMPTANATGWTVLNASSETAAPNAFDTATNTAEFWGMQGFSIKQTLTSLPAGMYQLKATALTRTGYTTTLSANDNTMNIATVSTGQANSRTDVSALFNAGYCVNELNFTLAEAGDVTIGLTTGTTGDAWTVWRNFSLEYLGTVSQVASELNALITAAKAVDVSGISNTTVTSFWSSLISDAETAYNNGSPTSADAVAASTQALTTYQPVIEAIAASYVSGSAADFTAAIVNPGFEQGNLTGWTTTTSDDTGAKATNDNTYRMSNYEGNYLFNTWAHGYPITQTITGLPNGYYTLSAVLSSAGGRVFLLGNGAYNGIVCATATVGYQHSMTVHVTDGTLTLGAVGSNNDHELTYVADGVWWYKADNFQLQYLGTEDPITAADIAAIKATIPTGKMQTTTQSALDSAKDAFNAESSTDNYHALYAAILPAMQSAYAYSQAKATFDSVEDLLAATNIFSASAKSTFDTGTLNPWTAKYENGTMTNDEAIGLNTTFYGNTWASHSYPVQTLLIDAWDNIIAGEEIFYVNTWSTEGNSDGSGMTTPFFEYWTADASTLTSRTLTAHMDNMPAGDYTLTALVRVRVTNNAAVDLTKASLQINDATATTFSSLSRIGETQFYYGTVTATATTSSEGTVTFKFNIGDGANLSWLSFKNVKYTCAASPTAAQWTTLKGLIDAAESSLGFANGEYAPYRNVAAITQLSAAKEIYAEKDDAESTLTYTDVADAIQSMQSATWYPNSGEVNAFCGGDFTQYETVDGQDFPYGWNLYNGDSNKSRIMGGTEGTTNAGLSASSSGKALLMKYNATYGEAAGYTMPLKAGQLYKLTFKYCGWNDSNQNTNVVITDPASNSITLKPEFVPATSDGYSNASSWATYTGYFVSTTAGNYLVNFNKVYSEQRQIAIADIDLRTSSEALTFAEADGSHPAFAAGTYPTVALDRTFSTTGFSTVVLPFALDATATADVFSKVYELNAVSGESIRFTEATSITAGKPYLVQAKSTTLSATDVAVDPATTVTGTAVNDAATEVTFTGTFSKIDALPTDGSAYVVSGTSLYSVDSAVSLKAYRAYFVVSSVGGVKHFVLDFNGISTDVHGIEAATANAPAYNLAGQRVQQPRKGIYVVGGKKMVVR